MFLSLFLHSLAHIAATKAGSGPPHRIFFSPLGDPAHFWPAEPHAGKEVLVALAGPLIQCLLAALSYLLWNLQINIFTNTMAFFLIFFNFSFNGRQSYPGVSFRRGPAHASYYLAAIRATWLSDPAGTSPRMGYCRRTYCVGYCLNFPTSPFSL